MRSLALAICAWLLLACSLPSATASGPAKASAHADELRRFEYRQTLMGVPVSVLVYADDEPLANSAVHAALDRIRELNLVFSDYDDDSETSRLCRTSGTGKAVTVSADMANVLSESISLAKRSNGRVDVTVGPYVWLWRKARRQKNIPSADELLRLGHSVGIEHVRFDHDRRTAELLRPGMRLDFGALVKGFAAHEAVRLLKEKGVSRALVGLAGDIATGDPPPGQPAWQVEVQNFESETARPLVLSLANRCVSTSGDLFQFIEIGGKRYSHLVDPRTGLGLTDRISATVVAPRGIDADGLSTAACLLGRSDGLKLLAATPGVEGRIVEVSPDGLKVAETAGFTALLASNRSKTLNRP